MINHALNKYLDIFVIVYLDNILVFSKGIKKEHIKHIRKVLAKMVEHKLLIHLEKSKFHVEQIEFLGFVVLREGMEISPNKVKDILE